MKRQIFENLRRWKQDKSRKPLVLKGARQVGKTYTLMTFGRLEYENVAYFNFESSPQLQKSLTQRGRGYRLNLVIKPS